MCNSLKCEEREGGKVKKGQGERKRRKKMRKQERYEERCFPYWFHLMGHSKPSQDGFWLTFYNFLTSYFYSMQKTNQVLYNIQTFYKRYFLSNPVKPSSESVLNALDS